MRARGRVGLKPLPCCFLGANAFENLPGLMQCLGGGDYVFDLIAPRKWPPVEKNDTRSIARQKMSRSLQQHLHAEIVLPRRVLDFIGQKDRVADVVFVEYAAAGALRQFTGESGLPAPGGPGGPPGRIPWTPAMNETSMSEAQELSFFDAVGGEETFRRLTHRFYLDVAADPLLRAVYPSKDLGPAEEHLRLFLIQYWGGPGTYGERRGHPRLRMRHAHFTIGEAERDAWLRHMRAALDELDLDEAHAAQLWDYLVMAANSLVNQPSAVGHGPDLGLTPR